LPPPTQDEESIDSTSLLKSNSQYSTSYVNQKQVNYGYSQKTFIPKGGSFGAPTHFNRRFQSFGSGGGSHFALSAPNYASSFQLSGPPAPPVSRRRPSLRATTTRATTTTRYLSKTTDINGILHQFDSSIDQFHYDADSIPDDIDPDDDSDGIPDDDDPDHPSNIDTDGDGIPDVFDLDNEVEVVTEKPKDPAFLDCKISIYSKTYNRGDSFTLETENSDKNQTLEIKDLNKAGFDNKLVSLQVSGGLNGTTNCCFGVYSEPEFRGDFLHFRFNPYNDGKYESASDMGKLFRAATSIQLLDETCTEPYNS